MHIYPRNDACSAQAAFTRWVVLAPFLREQEQQKTPEAQRRNLPAVLQLVNSRGRKEPQAVLPPGKLSPTVHSDLQAPTEIFIA